MKTEDFKTHYKRLQGAFPKAFDSEARFKGIFRVVGGLGASWWSETVDQVIASSDHEFDFTVAANSERRRLAGLKSCERIVAADLENQKNISDAGLSKALEAFGASSVFEAAQNWRSAK